MLLMKYFLSMNTELDKQLEFPNVQTRIFSPSMLVIPIAIYS